MEAAYLNLLRYFRPGERTLNGKFVDWTQYDYKTMTELDRLRHEIGSRCVLIRGGHGYLKETAVDAVFPDADFSEVVMAMMRSGFSKGFYQGGSIHLDGRMGPSGLARCWMAFKPGTYEYLLGRGFGDLRTYTKDTWDYYRWGGPKSWDLLKELVTLNTVKQVEV